MPILRKADLKKIWDWLKITITDKDLEWLKKHHLGGKWNDFSIDNELWEKRFVYDNYQLSFSIQEVINAKGRYNKAACHYAGGLPKFYLREIAKMLGLNVTENNFNWQLANQIIGKINNL